MTWSRLAPRNVQIIRSLSIVSFIVTAVVVLPIGVQINFLICNLGWKQIPKVVDEQVLGHGNCGPGLMDVDNMHAFIMHTIS